MKLHHYTTLTEWTGNTGNGTAHYQSYERDYTISATHKPTLLGSSDPSFRGDPARYNPEELFLASLSSCHMLWYLHLCSENGVNVVDYRDKAVGTMAEDKDGSGRFTDVILHPEVTVLDASMITEAKALHHKANKMCFIANSCNFPIRHEPVVQVAD